MPDDATRKLTNAEEKILIRMLELSIPERQKLQEQISASRVRTLDEMGSLEFFVDDGPKIERVDGPIVSALQPDEDTVASYGPYINYILFVRNGTISELQIYKDNSNAILTRFDPEKITAVFAGKGRESTDKAGE